MIQQATQQSIVQIFASPESWIEGEAVRQLEKTAALESMKRCVGLPDLHPGRGTPVGAAFYTDTMIYPFIVGNDVGCGIGLWQTTLQKNKIKRDKWVRKLTHLNSTWSGKSHSFLRQYDLEPTVDDAALGTIGSGNHFVELQRVEKVFCSKRLGELGLDPTKMQLLVHSGSRGIGEALLRKHTDQYGAKGLNDGSKAAEDYLKTHDFAVAWARCNRALIAKRFVDKLNADCRVLLDLCHNSVEQIELYGKPGWLHRKGAAPSDQGMVVIPGSRGSLSYLVAPTGNQIANLWSLAHGAGRKWKRKSCKDRLKNRYSAASMRQTSLGSVVICNDKESLYEEAPQAYKNIETVIAAMQTCGLLEVIATLRPLITYKSEK